MCRAELPDKRVRERTLHQERVASSQSYRPVLRLAVSSKCLEVR